MKILVTGAAGFIGYHVVTRLLEKGESVFGLDSITDYYDINLKYARLRNNGIEKDNIKYNHTLKSSQDSNLSFIQLELKDKTNLDALFAREQFDVVINLAAQAGVRYSLSNPEVYVASNIVGFANILECCRHNNIKHLVYASSSSVYGLNEAVPFSTSQNVDHPISLYAASKKSNELMAHVYSHLFKIPTTGLRFFTVYGPWGRPDMAVVIFTKSILEGTPIPVFNHGNMLRDFTYVDDIVNGVVKAIENPALPNELWDPTNPDPATSTAPYRLYNIGSNSPVSLLDFIHAIEDELGIKANMDFLPLQPGDVLATYADVKDLVTNLNYKPNTTIKEGIRQFISWYKTYYK